MTRKSMAERYAAQRSSKPIRRRTLPRLSDSETALEERSSAGASYDDALEDYDGPQTATFTAGAAPAARTQGATLPRRAPTAGRRSGIAIPSTPRVDYAYVKRDLRRIAITAVCMLILLIVLNVLVQHVIG